MPLASHRYFKYSWILAVYPYQNIRDKSEYEIKIADLLVHKLQNIIVHWSCNQVKVGVKSGLELLGGVGIYDSPGKGVSVAHDSDK